MFNLLKAFLGTMFTILLVVFGIAGASRNWLLFVSLIVIGSIFEVIRQSRLHAKEVNDLLARGREIADEQADDH
jgi:hypothetical protein